VGSRDVKVIDVDLDTCVGHGKCYMLAPELFDAIDDDGRAGFVGDPIDPDDPVALAAAERAVAACPEYALTLRDAADPREDSTR
jgi:ferredoxin